MLDRHDLRLGPAEDVDVRAEHVLHALRGQVLRERAVLVGHGLDGVHQFLPLGVCDARALGATAGGIVRVGNGAGPSGGSSTRPRSTSAASASAVRSTSVRAELDRRLRRPAGDAVGREARRGVAEHQVRRCGRGRRRRPSRRGPRAPARSRASPRSRPGWRGGRRRRRPSPRRRSGRASTIRRRRPAGRAGTGAGGRSRCRATPSCRSAR